MFANILSLYLFSYLRPGSNRHVHNGHRILSPARLPIPPLRHLYLRAENETRTRDPDLGKVVLYQLSYFRKNFVFAAFRRDSEKQILICFSLAAPKSPLTICKILNYLKEPRAENETRTRDPDLGKVVLYQLSYFRLKLRCKDTAFFNTANVFLKKIYINYNLLIFNKNHRHFD